MDNSVLTSEGLYALAEKAFNNNEVVAFLSGEKGYACPLNHFVPVDLPTDFEVILTGGIFALYNKTQNNDLIIAYKNAIVELMNGTPIQTWIGFMVVHTQLMLEMFPQFGNSPFKLITQDIIQLVRTSLLRNKCALSSIQKWQGRGLKDGLWQEIVRINNITYNNFGVTFL